MNPTGPVTSRRLPAGASATGAGNPLVINQRRAAASGQIADLLEAQLANPFRS